MDRDKARQLKPLLTVEKRGELPYNKMLRTLQPFDRLHLIIPPDGTSGKGDVNQESDLNVARAQRLQSAAKSHRAFAAAVAFCYSMASHWPP
jgi:hypothetical protein